MRRLFWILFGFLFGFLLMWAVLTPHSAAEDVRSNEVLWLARICMHEAGWYGARTNDCGAIMQVLNNRATANGWTFMESLQRTCPRFYGGTSEQPWAREFVIGLDRNPGSWPERWPGVMHYADDFRGVYDRAYEYMSGQLAPPCTGEPRNWMSRRHPRDRAVTHRHLHILRDWQESDCGETRNRVFERRR